MTNSLCIILLLSLTVRTSFIISLPDLEEKNKKHFENDLLENVQIMEGLDNKELNTETALVTFKDKHKSGCYKYKKGINYSIHQHLTLQKSNNIFKLTNRQDSIRDPDR